MWSYVRKKLKKKCLEMGSRNCRLAAAVVRQAVGTVDWQPLS